MEAFTNFAKRVSVVLKAAPTWLLAASTAITITSEELVKLLPDTWDEQVVRWAAVATGAIAAAVAIIRRVSPVLPDERGLLPPPGRHEEPAYDEFSPAGRGPTTEPEVIITEDSGHDHLAGP
jgi:hypothetical protein